MNLPGHEPICDLTNYLLFLTRYLPAMCGNPDRPRRRGPASRDPWENRGRPTPHPMEGHT